MERRNGEEESIWRIIRGILALLDGESTPVALTGFFAGFAMIDGCIQRRVVWHLRGEEVAK